MKTIRPAVTLFGILLAFALSGQTIEEHPLPTPASFPGDIALGPDGGLWFTESQGLGTPGAPNRIGHRSYSGVVTPDTGYFWFFVPENVELVVKVLDGCHGPSPRYWVFAGGLTNARVTLRVTDLSTGDVRVYDKPQGPAFPPIQDTSAFATCP